MVNRIQISNVSHSVQSKRHDPVTKLPGLMTIFESPIW